MRVRPLRPALIARLATNRPIPRTARGAVRTKAHPITEIRFPPEPYAVPRTREVVSFGHDWFQPYLGDVGASTVGY